MFVFSELILCYSAAAEQKKLLFIFISVVERLNKDRLFKAIYNLKGEKSIIVEILLQKMYLQLKVIYGRI